MRTPIVLALIAIAALVWSCGGSSTSTQSPTAAASPTSAAAKSSTASAPAARTPTEVATDAGAADEVTGIVGTVIKPTRTIEIDRLSGAPVRKITVDDSTVIERVSGDTITLSEVRVSDRIVASGHLNDRQDALIATHVTVQDVLPGAQPGG